MHVTYLKLVSFSNSHHHVYCDNYFSSVRLFCDLERNGIYACGTLRTNRKGFPGDMKKFSKKTYKFKERGDNEIRQHNNLTVTLWQDNKVVCMLATNGDPTKIETVPPPRLLFFTISLWVVWTEMTNCVAITW